MIALAAAAIAAAVSGLVAWCGPVDPPGPRRGHGTPTPTSGGLAIVVATCAGLGLAAYQGITAADSRIGWLALLATLMGLMGAADDMFDLPARTKLLVQIGLTVLFARIIVHVSNLPLAPSVNLPLNVIVGVAGTTLWFVVLTNAVNFVDGANGLAPGAVIVSLVGLAVSAGLNGQPVLSASCAISAAAGLGFLPWNLPGRRLFQGDAGALFSGALLAGLAVLAAAPAEGRPLSPYLVPFATLPMLTDVLLTLLVRAGARERLFDAHRDHLYQVWLDARGASHAMLSLLYWAIMAAFTTAAVLNEQAPMGYRPLGFGCAVMISAAGWVLLRRRLRRAG